MTFLNTAAIITCLGLLPVLVTPVDDSSDLIHLLRHRGVVKPGQRLMQFSIELSESFDQPGGDFELNGSLDRPGTVVDDGDTGDAFEMDARMPKRSFELSESASEDQADPNRVPANAFGIATPAPADATRTTMSPSTSKPTTLTPTTLKPTTLSPTKAVTPQPTTLQPTEPKRSITLPPTTLEPTTLEPTTLQPTTLKPTTLQPTKIYTKPPTAEPSSLPTSDPTTPPPVSLHPTTLEPTTLAPTTLLPTTVAPTSNEPTLTPTEPPTQHPPPTPQPTAPPSTLSPTEEPTPTSMPTQGKRAPELIRDFFGEDSCEQDYVIPEGGYCMIMPGRLLHELIKTLKHGRNLVEPLFGPYGSEFKMDEFLYALNISYDWDVNIADNFVMHRNGNRDLAEMQAMVSNIAPTPSPTSAQMNLGGERDGPGKKGRVDLSLAHMGLLLGQAYEESMITGMCDEQNTNPVDKANPGCGQDGQNYRFPNTDSELGQGDFACFANEKEWMTGFRPVLNEANGQLNKEFVGCPLQPPVNNLTGNIMLSNHHKDEYQELPMKCGLEANIGSLDCCWWGRGMLQMTHQCNYGDFQQHWGAYYQVPDREDIDICMNPGQVCSNFSPEMKYLTALFAWTKNVVHNPHFNFNQELELWVDSGMKMGEGTFVDRVGGALVYGDPNKVPPNAIARQKYTKAAVEAVMSIPAFGVEQYRHYGDVALCKPAVQSSIFNSTSDHAARSALTGKRNATKIAETNCDTNPFWKVDLGRPYQIVSVHVVWYERYHQEMMDLPEYNARGTSEITTTNHELVVDLLDYSGKNVGSLDRSQFIHSIEVDGKIESEWTVSVENSTDLMATQVRVSIASPNNCAFLSLAQVMVMSVCELGDACLTRSTCEEQNVAKCKPAVQSSTVGAGTADLATDGLIGELATTECEASPYFMVDLMGMYNITAVALLNHADSNGLERLNGVVVELLDIDDNVVAQDSHELRLMGDKMGDVYVMKFNDKPTIASKVRVSLQHAPGSCEPLKLAEVVVMGTCLDEGEPCKTWENCRLQNIARCMPATQSSIFEGGIAARAVDGHMSLAHTICEEKPWWGVHILGSHAVSKVVIHNRQDCCFERLNNVEVSLLDDEGNTLSSVIHHPGTDGVIETSWTAVFPEPVTASKVLLATTHDSGTCHPLNLAEVEVMSPCGEDNPSCLNWGKCDNGNIAQCKPAQQSSTLDRYVAGNAVNGHESLAHTGCENAPWWEVDLLSSRLVDGVVIHNREDCCWERLNGILIELIGADGHVTASIKHDPTSMGEIKTMWVATFVNAIMTSRVRLSIQHAAGVCDFLNLAEVEVRSTCQEGDVCLTGFGCDRGNVAKCKPARQSSTLPAVDSMTVYQGIAGDAVDGTASLAHTDCEQKPWWEVDLVYRRVVSEVVIHNREDCCFDRLNGAIVDLLDKEHNVIARVQHDPAADGEINTMWVAAFPPMSMGWYARVMLQHAEGACGFLNLVEVEVMSTCEEGDACMHPEAQCVQGNVAQCKPARQISTVEGAIARNAVDGEQSHSRTDCEEQPWWEVDLQGVYHVNEVVVFSRNNYTVELNNVMVELLNSTGDTVNMMQHDPITDGVIDNSWTAKFDDFGDNANKVRVSLLNDVGDCSFLNLGGVQVMSTCLDTDVCYYGYTCGDGNVARCKPASQSSTRGGMVAEKALDGEETLSMTECEVNPWWTVDLQTDYAVKEVAVYNRRDCCFEQLNGALVELLDSTGAIIASAQHDPAVMGEIKDVWVAHFDPTNNVPSRSVRVSVRHKGDSCGYLELAEVEVFSACKETDACMTGFNCEQSWMQST